MHIVYVSREYPPSKRSGGIASYIKEMATSLVAIGHQVTVVAASDDTRLSSDQMEEGIRVIRLKGGNFIIPEVEPMVFYKRFRGIYRYKSYCKRIRKTVLALQDVDIVEVAEFGAESFYLHNIGIPIVIRLHAATLVWQSCIDGKRGLTLKNLRHYYMDVQELNEVQRCQYITSCSTSLKQIMVEWLRIEKTCIKVIYNPVNISKWSDCRHSKANNSDGYLILQAGTVTNVKGCEDLIKACLILKEKTGWKLTLKLVGKNSAFAEYLRSAYSQYDWISIGQQVLREELKRLYVQADVVCVSSWWENMPMACIEAMLCGCIVIGTQNGGISEIIQDGENGFLMEPKNPEDLAKKLEKVLSLNLERKREISVNATRRIKTAFSSGVIISQMLEYYQWVIKDFKRK